MSTLLWVLIKFPHEESGKQRKLSRPWHGAYLIMSLTDTDHTASRIYFPEDGPIKVHQSHVSPYSVRFPAQNQSALNTLFLLAAFPKSSSELFK